MSEKKWDVYVYGDVNADIIIPGVEKFPAPGQEDLVPSMETYVGGGAALFTLGLGRLGSIRSSRGQWETIATDT